MSVAVRFSSERLGQNTAQNGAKWHTLERRKRRKRVAYTREQWESRIKEAGAGRYDFVRWAVNGEYGALKKCVVRCVIDGFEWESAANNITSHGIGCPQCSGVRRWTAEERI